jgi:hypothetical protein
MEFYVDLGGPRMGIPCVPCKHAIIARILAAKYRLGFERRISVRLNSAEPKSDSVCGAFRASSVYW